MRNTVTSCSEEFSQFRHLLVSDIMPLIHAFTHLFIYQRDEQTATSSTVSPEYHISMQGQKVQCISQIPQTACHTCTLPSLPAEAIRCPSGDQATVRTLPWW